MDKNKMNYLAIVLAFCVVIAGLGGFWLGTQFGGKEIVKQEVKDSNKEEALVIPEDIETIFKMLNYDSKEDINFVDSLSENAFLLSIDGFFGDSNENLKSGDHLKEIAPVLMESLYNAKLVSIDNQYGKTYLLDNSEYEHLREYFNVTIDEITSEEEFNKMIDPEKVTDKSKYINNGYYYGYATGDGYGDGLYKFEIDKLNKLDNDKYEVMFNVNELLNKELVATGKLVYSYKNNHIYYEEFKIDKKN